MTKTELALIFAEELEEVSKPESREKVVKKLLAEQDYGDDDAMILRINTEIILERALMMRVLARVLPQVSEE